MISIQIIAERLHKIHFKLEFRRGGGSNNVPPGRGDPKPGAQILVGLK